VKKPPAKKSDAGSDPQDMERPGSVVQTTSTWSGPLPPPSVLADFDEVVENGAERIMAAWESETAHRRDLEKSDLRLSAMDSMLGKVFALIFVLSALGVSAYAASIGAQWLGVVLGGGVIGSVVWAFVTGQKSK
jgi:uncharacterized membrane protein